MKVGDVVRLKSGGPVMTVASLDVPMRYSPWERHFVVTGPARLVACAWFETDPTGASVLKQETFCPDALELVGKK